MSVLQINIIPLPVTMNRKIKKPPVRFSAVNKTMNKTSLITFSMLINVNVLVQILLLHSFIYSIPCLVK